MTAEQKAHVLAQLNASINAAGSAIASIGRVGAAEPMISDAAALGRARDQITQARERLEIAQYAIDGMLKVTP